MYFQRYEDLSQKWDQAKAEVRQDDYEQLKRKVELQQELIRRQDALAEQKKTLQEQEIKQVYIYTSYCLSSAISLAMSVYSVYQPFDQKYILYSTFLILKYNLKWW